MVQETGAATRGVRLYNAPMEPSTLTANKGEELLCRKRPTRYCAYCRAWHGLDSFSVAQKTASRERRYCMLWSNASSRAQVVPSTEPTAEARSALAKELNIRLVNSRQATVLDTQAARVQADAAAQAQRARASAAARRRGGATDGAAVRRDV